MIKLSGEPEDNGAYWIWAVGIPGPELHSFTVSAATKERCIESAYLLAAAKDMLYALTIVCRDYHECLVPQDFNLVENAIIKATDTQGGN